MDKERGSAMVLAILLLSFFMALSLNMWFLSQKKAQRAGDKIIGNKVLTDIDGSSTLGYYEFYLATEYLTKGFVTSTSYGAIPTVSTTYSSVDGTGIETFSTTYEGIQLERIQDYFGSYLSSSGALSTSANAILREEVITGTKLESRRWLNGLGTISELWSDFSRESLGGYKIDTIKVEGLLVADKSAFDTAMGSTAKKVSTLYKKTIYFSSTSAKLNPITYNIMVERESEIKQTGSTYDYTSDEIKEIIVTKQ